MNDVDVELLPQLRKKAALWSCRWAAYQNQVLEPSNSGDLRLLAVGPGRTFEMPPSRYPDTGAGTGWRYGLIGFVNLETGAIEREENARQMSDR